VVPPCPVTTLGFPSNRGGGGLRYLHLIVRRWARRAALSRDNPGLAKQYRGGRTTILTSGREEAAGRWCRPVPRQPWALPNSTEGGRTIVLTSGREEVGQAVVPPGPVTTLGLPNSTGGGGLRYLHLVVRRRAGRWCCPVP
jgi:hypothetical protein